MDIRNARTRLRRTFHYPTDESSNGSTPEVLDEEEQEKLIQDLAERNATHNQQYQIILLALPILSCIPYLLALFRPSTALIAVLGLTSLASTAYLLFSLHPTETGIHALDRWASSGSGAPSHDHGEGEGEGEGDSGPRSGISTLSQRRRRRRRASSFSVAPQKSPLERHLPLLNVGLCAVLVLYGLLVQQRGNSEHYDRNEDHSQHFGWLGLGNLPAIVYAVVIVAKLVMANVDPERELTALRYDYKGA